MRSRSYFHTVSQYTEMAKSLAVLMRVVPAIKHKTIGMFCNFGMELPGCNRLLSIQGNTMKAQLLTLRVVKHQ